MILTLGSAGDGARARTVHIEPLARDVGSKHDAGAAVRVVLPSHVVAPLRVRPDGVHQDLPLLVLRRRVIGPELRRATLQRRVVVARNIVQRVRRKARRYSSVDHENLVVNH
jgi:hypothetical protein